MTQAQQQNLHLFFTIDNSIYLKGPFKNWEEIDEYCEKNLDDAGFLYFNTSQGEMLFSPWSLAIINDPDYQEELVWV